MDDLRNNHSIEEHKRVIKRWRIINSALFIVIGITVFMRIWPLAAEFMFSNVKKAHIEDHNNLDDLDDYDATKSEKKDGDYLMAQFIGYSMVTDVVVLTVGFFALYSLKIKFILATFLLGLLSLILSTPMVHPTENPLLTIFIFSPIVVLQILSSISLCFLMHAIKQLEYHQLHLFNSRRTTLTSVSNSLERCRRPKRLPRSFSMPQYV